jgi:hypothetical protein
VSVTALRVQVISPSRNTLIRAVASLVLSCQPGVLYSPEQRPKKATFLAKAPLLKVSNFGLF